MLRAVTTKRAQGYCIDFFFYSFAYYEFSVCVCVGVDGMTVPGTNPKYEHGFSFKDFQNNFTANSRLETLFVVFLSSVKTVSLCLCGRFVVKLQRPAS